LGTPAPFLPFERGRYSDKTPLLRWQSHHGESSEIPTSINGFVDADMV